MARTWKCKLCDRRLPRIKQKCPSCGRKRPPARKPAHMRVLKEMPREEWESTYGLTCNICGAGPGTRALHRDHEHRGAGKARGLLCFRCNTALKGWMTAEWLQQAANYLRR